MNKRIIYLVFLVVMLPEYSCKRDPKTKPKYETKNIAFPHFNKDSAFAFVQSQVNFGPRVPNTEAHKKCAAWFAEKFSAYNAEIEIQEFQAKAFNGKILNGKNIVARYNPAADKRIVLAAHWDSRPFSDQDSDPANRTKPVDGADDGASGAGVLVEVARLLARQKPNSLGVDIVLFDCEDYGTENNNESWGLGSQHWSKQYLKSEKKAVYGVLLDMVGAGSPRFQKEGFSMRFAPHIVDKIWSIAKREGFGKYFVDQIGPEIIDDHYFVNTLAKLPMVNIINRPEGSPKGFVPHWHTQHDNMSAIDPFSLQMVGKVLVKLIYREDAQDF